MSGKWSFHFVYEWFHCLQEQEARTNALRIKARSVYDGRATKEEKHEEEITTNTEESTSKEHVNFFKELEEGLVAFTGTNKDYEKEKKEEKEKYEKQIGYLTYLGQDTNESTGNVSWYEKAPNRLLPEKKEEDEIKVKEANLKSKKLADPLNSIRRYLDMTSDAKRVKEETIQNNSTKTKLNTKIKRKRESSRSEERERNKKKKSKRSKHSHSKKSKKKSKSYESSESSNESSLESKVNLEVLRAKRLQREKEEKMRAERLLAKLRGETLPEDKPKPVPTIEQKYSSQFNPHLAKQNFSSEKRKY